MHQTHTITHKVLGLVAHSCPDPQLRQRLDINAERVRLCVSDNTRDSLHILPAQAVYEFICTLIKNVGKTPVKSHAVRNLYESEAFMNSSSAWGVRTNLGIEVAVVRDVDDFGLLVELEGVGPLLTLGGDPRRAETGAAEIVPTISPQINK